MKNIATLTFLLTLLILAPQVSAEIRNNVSVRANSQGGESNVNVKVDNNVNSSSQNTISSQTKTDVHISQSGEGKSQVTINGKEYKLEGPGELNISNSTASPSPTLSPSASPTSSPQIQEETKNQLNKIMELLQQIFTLLKKLSFNL